MGKIAKSVNKIYFTMLYRNYCYIFLENFPQKFSSCNMKISKKAFHENKASFMRAKIALFFSRYNAMIPYHQIIREDKYHCTCVTQSLAVVELFRKLFLHAYLVIQYA